jgi:hypothetical protein
MKTIERTENNIISISLAFSAMKYNLVSIEEGWVNHEKHIPIIAYFNYLSLYALCIELGLKNIIINQTDIKKTHNIKDLFYKTHRVFQEKIQLLYKDNFKAYFLLDDFLNDVSNMFEDLRYLDFNEKSNYGKFLEEEAGAEIDLIKLSKNNSYLKFLMLFCNEIYELLLFIDQEGRKKSKLNYPCLNEIEKINFWKKKILDECLCFEEVKI